MTITTIYLARHGETEWNQVRRLQGRLDSPLNEQGIQQAQSLAQSLVECELERIICSPLGRAIATAEQCRQSLGKELIVEKQLQERDFGDWQACLFDDLRDEPNFESVFFKVTDKAPPKGESGTACGNRIRDCLTSIAKQYPSQKLLIISHGDAIRCFLSQLNKSGAVDAYSQYGNGSVFELNYLHQSEQFILV